MWKMSKKNKIKVKEKIVNEMEEEIKTSAEQMAEGHDENAQTDHQQTEKTQADKEQAENIDTEKGVDDLAAAQNTINELKDKLLRTIAEFENYKKRTHKEKTELIFNGGEKTVSAILPVLDDMERAIENSAKIDDIKALEEGWELIFKKLVNALEGLGVNKIDTTDKDFNVDYHEAVAMVPGMGDDKKGKVIDCLQTGYTLNDKVIRHAKVAVGQ